MTGGQNTRAQLNWSKIRDAVFGSSNTPKSLETFKLKPDLFSTSIKSETAFFSHGIKLEKTLDITYVHRNVSIKTVIHSSALKCHIILFTDGNLCRYNGSGTQEIFICKERVLSITFADRFKSYVSVCADNNLRIVDNNLELVNAIPYSGVVNGIKYNPFTHEIVSYGTGSIIVWSFRTAGTLLIPHLIISDRILSNDSLMDISIERTSSEDQRCFSVIKNGVLVHNLKNGNCIQELQAIHNSAITKVFFFQPLQLLITSSKDGCIKSWNRDGSLHCTLIGHSAEVSSISMFPFGPQIMSTSYDGSLRIWSLSTKCETDCHKLKSIVYGVGAEFGVESIFCYTKNMLYLWHVSNLHSVFVVLRTKAISIKTTTNPKLSPVSYCICDDACIRIICPVTSEIVTVFISPGGISIIDAVYHLTENLLIVLLADGRIVEASAKTNPCSIKQIWSVELTNNCKSISLYEYMPESSNDDNEWNFISHKSTFNDVDDNNDKTMLFGGCEDGSIVVFEWKDGGKNGSIVFTLQAHMEEVIAMSANPKMDQLASTSKDKSLKIWRVFPFAEEALTPLLLFDHSMPIYAIQFVYKSLSVVYQDMAKAYHTIGIYKTTHKAKNRSVEQDVMKDHTDVILSITACPKLHLIASSSKDGVVHVRNTENDLISVLKLNDVAHNINFCSQRGNLLLAIGTNIHFISYKQYLPDYLMRQMIGMKLVEDQEVPIIPIDNDLSFTPIENSLLSKAHPSYLRFMLFVDDISENEQQRRDEQNKIKELEFSILQARDEELNLIREGNLKARKYATLSSLDKDIAFQKYMDIFYKRPDVLYPEDDPEEEENKFAVKVESSYKPKLEDGFFSVSMERNDIERIKSKLKKMREEDMCRRRKLQNDKSDTLLPVKRIRSLSLATDKVDIVPKERFIKPPLSASTTYVDRLKAAKDIAEANKKIGIIENSKKIDVASDDYPLNQVTKTNVNIKSVRRFKEQFYHDEVNSIPIAPDGTLPNSVIVALYKELRRESLGDGLKDWKPHELTADQLAEINDFNNSKKVKKVDTPPISFSEYESETSTFIEEKQSVILDQIMEIKESTPIETEEILTPLETPPDSPPPLQSQPVVEKEPIKKKPIQKFISTAIVVKPVRVRTATPTLSPLPQFILQFKECEWYIQCFPDLNSENFEKPHTVFNFVKLLLEALTNMKDYHVKSGIVSAILLLLQQEEFNEELTELVRSAILTALNMPGGEPSSQKSPYQQHFIKKCLQLLFALKGLSPIMVVELMVQFIVASSLFRKEIMKTFEDLGLQDAKGFFPTELLKFDVSLIIPSQQKSKLKELGHDWLSSWIKKLRLHISSLTGKIGRSSKGDVGRRGTVNAAKGKGILKKDDFRKYSKVQRGKSITFVSDDFVGNAAKNISPIDAINYFCEMMFEEHLVRLRNEALNKKINSANRDKNTILCLPKIEGYCSLVRLGETHKSTCHPERETHLSRVLPPIENNRSIRSLLLRVNVLKLAPFPDKLDELIYAPAANSNLITLRYSQKYFIPSSSIVQN